ncbi:hypothetical protein EFO61_00325 [Lacticaseibacillus rhamnosus]|nr:hypothetical protein BVH57_03240 [Lacticaseibacillus rhamnosus]EHJ32343.1 hypothetical protein HMPREF0541_01179 [Lacticaseibacillus rhamnosus ATCC 21052]OFT16019.1 hypothetical protein HMPREF3068_08735 [Lactobacillus sp. HMSC17G08]KMO64571.1 hypothetical protein PZ02_01750 [Lacticaseibacillus rhamnosus]MCT3143600.1 hypothetical protein [Lacticaseibacillus rhamnosus]
MTRLFLVQKDDMLYDGVILGVSYDLIIYRMVYVCENLLQNLYKAILLLALIFTANGDFCF